MYMLSGFRDVGFCYVWKLSEQYDHKEAEVFSIAALLQHCIVWQVLRHKDIGTGIVCFVLFY